MKSLRLETERENLDYALSHAELTEREQSNVKRRLALVEDELLELFVGQLPNQQRLGKHDSQSI
jgi:hypothetical protein